MTEKNNIVLVALLLAVLMLSAGLMTMVMNLANVNFTGAATGVTNLSISSLASIRMLRNISDFGTGVPSASVTLHLYSNSTNENGFNNGSEGNGTDYGEGTFIYPFVIENDGNDDSTCINITGTAAGGSFIGGTSPVFELASKNNETDACATGIQPLWSAVGAVPVTVCESLHTETGGSGANTIRIHWHLGIPYDATTGTQSNTITISAYGAC